MKISNGLPSFEKQKALIIVAGKHAAMFYIAGNGKIDELERFKVLHPKYSDHEGFAQLSGHGMVYRRNFLSELQENETINKFLREIKAHVKRVIGSEKPDSYYIFVPKFLQKEIVDVLPKAQQRNIKKELLGNFVNRHPFELLEMIKKDDEKNYGQRVPVSEEARKILNSDL